MEPTNNGLHGKGNVQVLCLGLSRTGTMSLRAAFERLGYHGVYHYRVPAIEQPEHCEFWAESLRAKFERGQTLARQDFDKVYSNYDVITDSPSVFFWEELLVAYPDATVVLQTRDIDAWYKSHLVNIWPMNRDWYKPTWNPYGILFQYFLPKNAMFEFTGVQAKYGHGLDFPETGKQRYIEHNDAVRSACKKKGRPVLEYDAKMGWDPLCEFLGKDVPQESFPRLNDTDEFQRLWAPILSDMRRTINQTMAISIIGSIGAFSAVLWWYSEPLQALWK